MSPDRLGWALVNVDYREVNIFPMVSSFNMQLAPLFTGLQAVFIMPSLHNTLSRIFPLNEQLQNSIKCIKVFNQ
jgi:precorrin-6B methylase 1